MYCLYKQLPKTIGKQLYDILSACIAHYGSHMITTAPHPSDGSKLNKLEEITAARERLKSLTVDSINSLGLTSL